MAKGHALLVGLTRVDVRAHGGWNGENGCWGCELDVENMARVLRPLGYRTRTLKTAEATHDAILAGLAQLAVDAESGDAVVFYFSGHGGQQVDTSGDELDGKDETLVAFDRDVIDDEIFVALKAFREGVRVVMISDSCNSGTNYRGLADQPTPTPFRPVGDDKALGCMLIHAGGCRDGKTSAGYVIGGAFTQALCNVWAGGAFLGTMKMLHEQVVARVKASGHTQDVTYHEYDGVSEAFRAQQALAIEGS